MGCLLYGFVEETDSYFTTFYIVPYAWLQIVRTMSTADYQRMKKCATVSIFRHKDSNFALSEAVNASSTMSSSTICSPF